MPPNFKRAKGGEKLVVQEMQKLIQKEQAIYGAKSLLREDGRLDLPGLKDGEAPPLWTAVKSRALEYLSNKWSKARGAEFGKVCHEIFRRLHESLGKKPPSRKEFVIFCNDIFRLTVPPADHK